MLLFFEIQLKSGCILGIMVLVYYIFLSKDTSFLRNRVWLLSSFVLPWCIPMLVMPIGLKSLLFGTKHVIHGIPIVNNNINNVATIIEVDNGFVSLETSVLSVYIAISIYLLIRLFFGYISIISFRKNSEIKSYKGFRLRIINDDSVIPFSFFRTIYVSRSIEDRKDINMILDHEATHCKHWHSMDILLIEWLLIFQWWNPFAWWLRWLIAQNHEYCVDSNMLKGVSQPKDYQYLLIDFVSVKSHLQLVNNFNYNFTKKRIIMMNKNKSNKYINSIKLVVILPIVTLLLSAFTDANRISETDINSLLIGIGKPEMALLKENPAVSKKPLYVENGVVVGHELILNPEEITSANVIKIPKSVKLDEGKGENRALLVSSKDTDNEFLTADDSVVEVRVELKLHGEPKDSMRNSALVYVDGVKKSTKYLNSLNPDGIESIEVLKDDNAVEKYGEDGKEGVVIVNTKKVSGEIEDQGDKKNKGQFSFKIKGLKATSMPIIYVDGEKKSTKYLESINPDDIESINVLKDADVIKSYGEEAKDGVILVKMKK